MLCNTRPPWNTTNLVPNSQHRYNPPTQPHPTPSRPHPSLPQPHLSPSPPHPSSQASPSNAPMDNETTSTRRRSPRWCVPLHFLRFRTPSPVRCLSLGRFRIRITRLSISSRTSCAVSSSNSYVIPRATITFAQVSSSDPPGPRTRQPPRRPIPHCRRPHLPHPTRQR